MRQSEFKVILEEIQLKSNRVKPLVLGDSIDDKWVFLHYDRDTQECGKPLPVFSLAIPDHTFYFPGGSSSAFASLKAFLPNSHFRSGNPRSTITRYVDENSGKVLLRVDENKVHPYLSLDEIGKDLLDASTHLFLSDYGRGFFSLSSLLELTRRFPDAVVSPDHFTCMRFGAFTEAEWKEMTRGIWITNREEAFHLISVDRKPDTWIVTKGESPVSLNRGDFEAATFSVDSVEAKHYCGIGDVFAASFCAARFCGAGSIEECIDFAIECSHRILLTGRPGTHIISKKDISHWLARSEEDEFLDFVDSGMDTTTNSSDS